MHRYLFILVVFAVVVSGCGRGFVPLRGKITYSDDGAPLPMGYIYLDNGKNLARGKINEDGTYIVGSLSKNDGLAPGLYRIYIQAIGPDPSGAREKVNYAPSPGEERPTGPVLGLVQMVSLIDVKYASMETSGLEVNVTRSTKTHDIVVDRPPYLKKK